MNARLSPVGMADITGGPLITLTESRTSAFTWYTFAIVTPPIELNKVFWGELKNKIKEQLGYTGVVVKTFRAPSAIRFIFTVSNSTPNDRSNLRAEKMLSIVEGVLSDIKEAKRLMNLASCAE